MASDQDVQPCLGPTGDCQKKDRVARVGGCVLYDTEALWETGGFARSGGELPPEGHFTNGATMFPR